MLQNDKNIVDVRGSLCPTPVIETKKFFENHPGEVVMTLVDNEVSRDNVKKFALSKGYKVEVETEGMTHKIIMAPGEMVYDKMNESYSSFDVSLMNMSPTSPKEKKGKVFVVTKNYLGEGSEELGRTLMKTFFHSLSEAEVKPKKIIFINGGVTLAAEGSPVLESLCALEKAGVMIESCGICLDYYSLKEKLAVGAVTNMYVIVEALTQCNAVVV